MVRSEAGTVLIWAVFYCSYGRYATNLQPTLGNWTWLEASLQCREQNARLAYMDEITAQINMSDKEILEDDVLIWINDDLWSSETQYPCGCLETSDVDNNASVESVRSPGECAKYCKDFPLFAVKGSECLCEVNITGPVSHSTCTDAEKYQLFKHPEPPEKCLLMYGVESQFIFNAKFVNCTIKAGIMCRTDVVKAMQGVKFTWSEANILCQNASSELINLDIVSDIERNRSIDVLNSRHYWTNGVVKHGKAGTFQIVDCIQSSGISVGQKINRNSVYHCNQLCGDSGRIALMGEQCQCLMEDDNVTHWRASGCTLPCFGNTRDRCGGNDSFSIYRRIYSAEQDTLEPLSDNCLAITKNSDNNITKHWQECRQRLDGCICRNGTINTSYILTMKNHTWAESQEECELHNMILATIETSVIQDNQWSQLQEGVTLWTGVYSPTVLEFSTETEVQNDDKCLSVTNFKTYEYDIEEMDCNQHQGLICHNDDGAVLDATTVLEDVRDHVTSYEASPDVTTIRMTPSFIIPSTMSSPYTGMSPMIIGLICTVVLVALVLTVILVVLAVLLYRFKEQKRQLNMLKGPTISYSNLEHSFVVSYNGAPSNEDSGGDIGNLENITEQMDALFVRKDELSPDEKSEHLYDVSDTVNNKRPIEQQNGMALNAPGTSSEPEDGGAYTEVVLCEETGNPTIFTNGGTCKNSSSSGGDANLEIRCDQRKPSLKVAEISNETVDNDNESNDRETYSDDDYDHTDSYVRRCRIETDTYDVLKTRSCKRPGSNIECLYDRVSDDTYDEIKTGIAAKPKVHYEDIQLNFDLP